MSYFFNQQPLASSSSSSTSPTVEQVKELKKNLSAVPSGSIISSRGQQGRSKLKNNILSKSYYSLGPRPRLFKSIPPNIITVNMSQTIPDFHNTSTTLPSTIGTFFYLTGFAGSAAYLSLFDQYRIDLIECWLEPKQSLSTVEQNPGTLASAVDLDDAGTPSFFDDVARKQDAVLTTGQNAHYHRWKPHMAVAVYSGAFTSFANAPGGWIDSGSPAVQHYGLKAASTVTSAVYNYNLQVRARVSFKQPGL
jgi:hypothetical protein